jgi:cytokinin riboside 5'-monophosphate phosphoribohydrolase
MAAICVYCSSSNAVHASYFAAARALGTAIAARGHTLIFGGVEIGLMGELARAARARGGPVVGVVPELARGSRHVFAADEVIYTPDLRARKQVMERRADHFVALPGGFGTLEELFEILTLKQLTLHTHPVVLFNHRDYYGPLVAALEHMFTEGFASAEHHRQLYGVADTVDGLFDYFAAYRPPRVPIEWS